MATPLQTVKARFGSKEALVTRLLPLLDRGAEESEAAFKDRLLRVSNTKLLTLLEREEALRAKFGSREALVDAIVGLKAAGGKPDNDFRRKALTLSNGRLVSMHGALARAARK